MTLLWGTCASQHRFTSPEPASCSKRSPFPTRDTDPRSTSFLDSGFELTASSFIVSALFFSLYGRIGHLSSVTMTKSGSDSSLWCGCRSNFSLWCGSGCGSWLLFYADPDPACFLMRMRIQVTKMMRIHADPDLQHYKTLSINLSKR